MMSRDPKEMEARLLRISASLERAKQCGDRDLRREKMLAQKYKNLHAEWVAEKRQGRIV